MPRSERLALGALVVVAAALRFTRIGHQSFWLDESFTVDLVRRPFGDMLSGVASTESTPPFYYVLAWLWAKLFGHGEAGLRSLSALVGTLTVPVAWRAAREWFSGAPRAGLVAAALVAFNPFFVWYSQEARSYSRLVLMAMLTLLFLGRRNYWLWALTAGLALLTHYFAAFLVVPEGLPAELAEQVEEDLAGQPDRNPVVHVPTEGLDAALAALPVRLSTMGRGLAEDHAYFLAAAAAGRHAAALATS